MMRLKAFWIILVLSAFTNATAHTNELDEDDSSIEDNSRPWHPYYRESEDSFESKKTLSDDAIFLPHEKFCQFFYAFDGTDSYIYRCANGYRFDAKKLECRKSKKVECGKRKKSIGSSEEDDVRIKCPKRRGVFPHSHYCHLFFYCNNRKSSLFMCPPGKSFDKKRNACYMRDKVDCGKREYPKEPQQKPATVTPSTTAATTTHLLSSTTTTTTPVPTTTSTTIPTTSTTIPTTSSTATTPVPETSSLTTPSPYPVTKPNTPPPIDCNEDDLDCINSKIGDVKEWFDCPRRYGHFPHDSSKQLFIHCNNWIPFVKTCTKGTIFSSQYLVCMRLNQKERNIMKFIRR